MRGLTPLPKIICDQSVMCSYQSVMISDQSVMISDQSVMTSHQSAMTAYQSVMISDQLQNYQQPIKRWVYYNSPRPLAPPSVLSSHQEVKTTTAVWHSFQNRRLMHVTYSSHLLNSCPFSVSAVIMWSGSYQAPVWWLWWQPGLQCWHSLPERQTGPVFNS